MLKAGDTVVGGRFELVERAAAGGMGVIFRARDRETGDDVAIKILSQSASSSATRFERETSLLATLEHPGIVRYLAHGLSDSGAPFLVSEWIEGATLTQRLARLGLTAAESIRIARQVAEALSVAHELGMIHRDLKPSNIMLAGDAIDQVKLLDFGIARLADQAQRFTRTGVVVGTPAYMSPEQARGDSDLDARSDVFGLGIVLYECLTARRPFEGANVMASRVKTLVAKPPPLSDYCSEADTDLQKVVARMLAKAPEVRYADGAAALAALTALEVPQTDTRRRTGDREDRPTAVMAGSRPAGNPSSLICVILMEADEPTDDDVETGADVLEALSPFGLQPQSLGDGSIVVTLSGTSPADCARKASKAALALKELMPDAAVGITAAASPAEIAEAIDRGSTQLASTALADLFADTDEGPAIYIDTTIAALVGDAHTIERDDNSIKLRRKTQTS